MSLHNILTAASADKKLERMAMEVAERNYSAAGLILIGIKENGISIAQIVAGYLKNVFSGDIDIVSLSIDKKKASDIHLESSMDFKNKIIILIDDVANTGRTMLYALQPLLRFYPAKIQTMALVERRHKLFPIALDYVGLSVSTSADENIVVEVNGNRVSGAYISSTIPTLS